MTFAKILGIGLPGLLTDLYVVSSTLCLGFWLGKQLGLDEALVTLISTGSVSSSHTAKQARKATRLSIYLSIYLSVMTVSALSD